MSSLFSHLLLMLAMHSGKLYMPPSFLLLSINISNPSCGFKILYLTKIDLFINVFYSSVSLAQICSGIQITTGKFQKAWVYFFLYTVPNVFRDVIFKFIIYILMFLNFPLFQSPAHFNEFSSCS